MEKTRTWLGVFVLIMAIHQYLSKQIVKNNACGSSIGCFHDCKQNGGCDFLITWEYVSNEGVVKMSINKVMDNPYALAWFAIGLSYDTYMGDDSVLECTTVGSNYLLSTVKQSYNEKSYNVDIFNSHYGLRDITGIVMDGVMQCNFTRLVTIEGMAKIFSLDKAWYLLAAHGYMEDGVKQRHGLRHGFPHVSPMTVDLRMHSDVTVDKSFDLVKAHGCLMVGVWVILASIAVVLGRFFKQSGQYSTGVYSSKWHMVHKILMMLVFVCTTVGFILIWLNTKGYAKLRGSNALQSSHPVLGVIIMGLTLVNPVVALMRPSPTSANSSVFRYAHSLIGTTVYILAVLNIIIGVTLPKAESPVYVMWLMVGFAIWQIFIYIVLEAHELRLLRTGQQFEYEASQIKRDVIVTVKTSPPGTLFKMVALLLHITVSIAVGVVCMLYIAI